MSNNHIFDNIIESALDKFPMATRENTNYPFFRYASESAYDRHFDDWDNIVFCGMLRPVRETHNKKKNATFIIAKFEGKSQPVAYTLDGRNMAGKYGQIKKFVQHLEKYWRSPPTASSSRLTFINNGTINGNVNIGGTQTTATTPHRPSVRSYSSSNPNHRARQSATNQQRRHRRRHQMRARYESSSSSDDGASSSSSMSSFSFDELSSSDDEGPSSS